MYMYVAREISSHVENKSTQRTITTISFATREMCMPFDQKERIGIQNVFCMSTYNS